MIRTFSTRGRLLVLLVIYAILAMSVGPVAVSPVIAGQPESTPVDLMLIIDNSCSVYEPGTPQCGSNALGSDPDFLRVTGASLFAARMAFGQAQPQDRIGAISMGTEPSVLYPLSPIEESRVPLAVAVDQPRPTGGTQVIEALKLAYEMLGESSIQGRKPVIVFLTDGVPVPPEGQSFADIERVVRGHPDTPLYVLLLQNQSGSVPPSIVSQYRAYIDDWKKFEQQMTNVQVYEVPDDEELLLVYNHVMADIAGGPSSLPPVTLKAGQSKEFYVSRFARRLYITAIHPDKQHRGHIDILDKSGQPLVAGEPGVEIFVEKDNQVEVYLASGPRLVGQTGGMWTITSRDATLSFFVDQRGAYRFDWLSPVVESGPLAGVLIMKDSVAPVTTIKCQFRLVDDQGAPILEMQSISGQVTTPDGVTHNLIIPPDLGPDTQGVYNLPIRLADYGLEDTKGRFEISLRSDDPDYVGPPQAIAVLKLWINADPNVSGPITPTSTPSPTESATPTPTFTATPTPSPTARPVPTVPPPPPTPCPNPPLCKSTGTLVLWGGLAVLVVLVVLYVLLRMIRKPPDGFVMVIKDGQPQPPKPLRKMAGGKPWRWWELTVGPQGDLRIRPNLRDTSSAAAWSAQSGSQGGSVTIPGVGVVQAGASTASGRKGKKKKSQTKRKKTLGRFIKDGGKTRFISLSEGAKITLTEDEVQTVSFGNVQLKMCLDRTKLV